MLFRSDRACEGQSDPASEPLGSCQKAPFSSTLRPAQPLTAGKGDPDVFVQAARALSYDYCRRQPLGRWLGGDLTSHRGSPQVAALHGGHCPCLQAGSCQGAARTVGRDRNAPLRRAVTVPLQRAVRALPCTGCGKRLCTGTGQAGGPGGLGGSWSSVRMAIM